MCNAGCRCQEHRYDPDDLEDAMAKRGRKRRARKKNAANHGKRPNA